MSLDPKKTLHYKRSHFATQLPVDFLYSPSHAWIAREPDNRCRVGLTKFATRMLGEMVDHGFEPGPGAAVEAGQIIGWIEGFKALSDIYCVVTGHFGEGNPRLKDDMTRVATDPYGEGWLYIAEGAPDPRCMDVHAYRDLLDVTIDKILEKQQSDESHE